MNQPLSTDAVVSRSMADLLPIKNGTTLTTQTPTSASTQIPLLIKELKEPESTRKLPKSEQILLLSASKFNGEKFPPWTRETEPRDFAELVGETTFREPTDMTLSKHQKQNLQAWARAPYALPPPSWYCGREGLFPTMVAEKPIDLVQDAASDCSVVASLCAERARVEKGHQSVSTRAFFG
jgi:calpain-7